MLSDDYERQRLLRNLSRTLRAYTDKANVKPLDGYYDTTIQGLSILRSDRSMEPMHRISKPALWVSVQGLKWAVVGEQRLDYNQGEALLITVEVPCHCTIPEATSKDPFLGLTIELDRVAFQEIGEVFNTKPEQVIGNQIASAMVIKLNPQLLDCIWRYVCLLDTPEAIPALHAGVLREISYWILAGPQASQAVKIAMARAQDQRTIQAIKHLRTKFRETIRVEDLANAAGMSIATFHRHFRSTTSLSPLQYQKQLRLLEARRLIMTNYSSITEVAKLVGYTSASQFSREYVRMFNKTPRDDREE